jgi:diaminopimelate epimerase
LTNHTLDDEMMTVNVASSTRKRHLGVEFVIWNRGNAWFWFLTGACGNHGSIGATASQTRAMREARWSIEAKLETPERDPVTTVGERNRNATMENHQPYSGPRFPASISDP